jgi:hypothetical protein
MGSLSSVDKVITIPASICHFGSHACFGYRILEESFKALSETFHSIIELCGTGELPCPSSSPPSSPDQDSILLPFTLAFSPKPKNSSVITMADFFTDEQFEEWLAGLARGEGQSLPSGSSVKYGYLIPFPLFITLLSDVIKKAKSNQKITNISQK